MCTCFTSCKISPNFVLEKEGHLLTTLASFQQSPFRGWAMWCIRQERVLGMTRCLLFPNQTQLILLLSG